MFWKKLKHKDNWSHTSERDSQRFFFVFFCHVMNVDKLEHVVTTLHICGRMYRGRHQIENSWQPFAIAWMCVSTPITTGSFRWPVVEKSDRLLQSAKHFTIMMENALWLPSCMLFASLVEHWPVFVLLSFYFVACKFFSETAPVSFFFFFFEVEVWFQFESGFWSLTPHVYGNREVVTACVLHDLPVTTCQDRCYHCYIDCWWLCHGVYVVDWFLSFWEIESLYGGPWSERRSVILITLFLSYF